MLNASAPDRRTGFRIYVIVSVVAFLFVGLYIAWVFSSRWEANRAIADKAAEKQRAQDQRTYELMGGDRFDILSYSANPATTQPGGRVSLCYSVSNTKTVKIEPQPEEATWPAFSRCVHVSPRTTTKYTLTIEDGGGHTKEAAVEVEVR